MPVEERATDIYTRDNLLLGFSQVYFTPLVSGVYGATPERSCRRRSSCSSSSAGTRV
jgi:hypothetical protein